MSYQKRNADLDQSAERMIWSLRLGNCRKNVGNSIEIYIAYCLHWGLTKAFDMVRRSGLWQLLRKFHCTEKFKKILKSLHEGMLGRVSIGGEFSEPFPVTESDRDASLVQYFSTYFMQQCSAKQQRTCNVVFSFVFKRLATLQSEQFASID